MAQEYKLKGVTALGLSPGDKQEVEVEGLDAKVLLLNAGGKIQAIGPNVLLDADSLPLAACFNGKTGDIEDAPGLDALPVFKTVERDGAVYIMGDAETIKSGRRRPNFKCSATGGDKVLVVGGGSGSLGVIEGLREKGFQGPITLISNEGYLPVDRPKISKALITDPLKIQFRDDEWYKTGSVQVVKEEVTGVDFGTKTVTTKSGGKFAYTKLVLSTGGTPRLLPLQGFKVLGNIFTLRNVHDAKKIVDAIGEKNKKIVIVGSSFIGMEIAVATSGGNDVTVVGMEKAPLERVLGEKVGNLIKSGVEAKGVKFYLSAGVDKAEPSESDPSKVGSVLLKDGTKLEADIVILGVGVAPATEYLRDNSVFRLEPDGSLKTDESFSVVGLKDVYAVGDIATYPYHGPGGEGKYVRIEHWNVAQNAGRTVANHIVNPSLEPQFFTPVFWSALGAQLRYCGNTMANGFDDVVLQGEPDKGSWVAYYTSGNTVVAVASMGKDPVVAQSAQLLQLGTMPTKDQLAAGFDVLSLAWQVREGRLFALGKRLHAMYGPVVRVGVDEVWGGLHFPDTLDLLSEFDVKRYRLQRRLMGPVYQAANLKKFEGVVDEVIERAVARLRELGGAEVDLKEWMHIITVECLGAVVLSCAQGYLGWKRKTIFGLFPLVTTASFFSKTVARQFANLWGVTFKTPKNFKPFFTPVYQKCSKRITAALRKTNPTNDPRKDLLADLISLHKARPAEFTEPYLRRLAVTNFGAGHETMTSALTAAMAMIASHPAAARAVATEVRLSSSPSSERMDEPYTTASIREAQRLHPVIGMALPRRVPVGPGVRLHGFHLRARTTVGCNPVSLHRDADIFGSDSDEFVPERWLARTEEEVRAMERYNLTWGGGARTCPGRNLAEMVLARVVGGLWRAFDVRVGEMPGDEEVRYYFMAMLTGVRVRFLPVERGGGTKA
ncbi:cytochrome P450 [Lasiosphaeris hirsuta]|uniref:Cytochrome P450 n=1 Tax=Lasiosphaeris hirsuta TaxID=260670 RepID=A0AA40A3A6_9PEZI|nr:cytochrome P450 [Lasiosphaeris hirsuta]